MANDTTDRLPQIVQPSDDKGGASCVDGKAPCNTTITEVPPHAKFLIDTHDPPVDTKRVKDDVEEDREEAENRWTWLS